MYPKTSLQGENLNEGNFGKLSLPSPVIFLDTPILENNIPIGSLDNESGQTQQQPEVYVYSWRNIPKRGESPVNLQQRQESKPNSGTLPQESNLTPEINDLDIPIALRKGVRSCTQYPISNFVRYDHLSSFVWALVTNLLGMEMPKSIYEALKIPKWKKVVMEEM